MSPLLLIALSMFVGFVFGYSACLWRWCSAEMAEVVEPDTEPGLRRCVTYTNLPKLPPGATHMLINGRPYFPSHGHDCLDLGCKTAHGGKA